MKNIERTILSSAVIALLAILVIKDGCGGKTQQLEPKIDTVVRVVIKEVHDTIKSKPKLVKSEPIIKWDTVPKYIPDTNYAKLLEQYTALGDKYFSRNIYNDSINIDTLGKLKVSDTVVSNEIVGRKFIYDFKKYEITKTITIREPYKPVNKVYFGGGITSSKNRLINSISLGILFQNKNDRVMEFDAGIGTDGSPVYGFSSYWKVRLKK
jgi:hypothetical protein